MSKKEWQNGIFQNKKLLAKHFGGASLGEIGAAFNRLDEDGSGGAFADFDPGVAPPPCLHCSWLTHVSLDPSHLRRP